MAVGHPQAQLAAELAEEVPDDDVLEEEVLDDEEDESDDDAAGEADVEDELFEPTPFAARLSVR